jgi:molybdopterin-guanine dinucleotide biosynthesis protein A
MAESRRQVAPAVSGIILAGGRSKRFGTDKAFLRLGSQTLIERIIDKLKRLSTDLVVVTNSPHRVERLGLPTRLIQDIEPNKGSLMGVYSGLRAVRNEYAVTVACDMPFLNLPLLRYMVLMTHGHDLVIPYLGGHLEPLHAVYGRSCLAAMEAAVNRGDRRIISFFDQLRIRYLEAREVDIFDPQHLSMLNVNTPSDWARVQNLIEKQRRLERG